MAVTIRWEVRLQDDDTHLPNGELLRVTSHGKTPREALQHALGVASALREGHERFMNAAMSLFPSPSGSAEV